MTYLAALIATVAALWLPVLYAVAAAPEGWEDAQGFHVGSKLAPNLDQFSYTGHDSAGAA